MKKKKDRWTENGYCPQHRKLRQSPLFEGYEWEQYCWPHTTGISSQHMTNSVWPSSWFLEHSFSEMPPSTFLKEQSSVCPLLRPLRNVCVILTAGSQLQKTSHELKPFQTWPLNYAWQNLHLLGVLHVSVCFSKHCGLIGGFCLCILLDKLL